MLVLLLVLPLLAAATPTTPTTPPPPPPLPQPGAAVTSFGSVLYDINTQQWSIVDKLQPVGTPGLVAVGFFDDSAELNGWFLFYLFYLFY